MKITKSKLKQIIKEELERVQERDGEWEEEWWEEESQGERLVAAPLRKWVDTQDTLEIMETGVADRVAIQNFDGTAVYNIGFDSRTGKIAEFSMENEKGEKRHRVKNVEQAIEYIKNHAGL